MNPQDSYGPPAKLTVKNPLSTMRPGEEIVCEIKRHPIGIIGMYAAVGLGLFVMAIVVFLVAPDILTNYSRGQVMLVGGLIFVATGIVSAGFLFVAHIIYWGNSWIVTTDSITQVKRIGLFDKQTSQLSFGNLEDITAEENGMLAQMLHFGVISAETAAATDKFTFIYCPRPTYYAQQILTAREHFEQNRHQDPEPPRNQSPEIPAASQPEPITSYEVPTDDGDIIDHGQTGISPD